MVLFFCLTTLQNWQNCPAALTNHSGFLSIQLGFFRTSRGGANSPSPGHGEEGLLPAGTNKALGTHERQWPGCIFALYAGCITNCIFRRLWDGGYTAGMAVLRGLRAAGAVLLAGTALFM